MYPTVSERERNPIVAGRSLTRLLLAIRKYSSGLNYYWNLLLDDDSLYVGGQYVSTLPIVAFVSP